MKKFWLFALFFLITTSCSSKKSLVGERKNIFLTATSIEVMGNKKEIKTTPAKTLKNYYGDHSTLNENIENYSVNNFDFKSHYIGGKNFGVGSYFFSSPIIVNDIIYHMDTSGHLIARNINNSEKPLWKTKIINRFIYISYYGGKLSFYDNTIFINTRLNEIIAVNIDGAIKWKKKLNTIPISTPVIDGNTIYLITNDNKLYALDTQDGRIKWISYGNTKDSAIFGAADPVIYKNYVIASYSSGELFVLNKQNGEIIFNTNLTGRYMIFSNFELTDIDTTPVIKNGILAASANNGITMGLNLTNMQIIWKQNLPSLTNILLNDNFIYLVTTDNIVVCLNINNGKIYWLKELNKYSIDGKKKTPIYYKELFFVNNKILAFNNIGEYTVLDSYTGNIEDINRPKFLLYSAPFSLDGKMYAISFENRAFRIVETK